MIDCFNNVLNFYKERYSDILENPEAERELNNTMSYAINVLEKSEDNLTEFFAIINGKKKHANMGTMDFPLRFLKGILDAEKSRLLNSIIVDSFMVGYVFHFMFHRFLTRDKIESVDFDRLYNNWLKHSIIADIEQKEYNDEHDGAPEEYFNMYYKENRKYDKAFTSVFKIGFSQKSKVYSFMRNIMFGGSIYAMSFDLATIGHY